MILCNCGRCCSNEEFHKHGPSERSCCKSSPPTKSLEQTMREIDEFEERSKNAPPIMIGAKLTEQTNKPSLMECMNAAKERGRKLRKTNKFGSKSNTHIG